MTSSHVADDYTEAFRDLANAYVLRGGLYRTMPRF
jgi:hypothetical protein